VIVYFQKKERNYALLGVWGGLEPKEGITRRRPIEKYTQQTGAGGGGVGVVG